jgi:hypothetical protein
LSLLYTKNKFASLKINASIYIANVSGEKKKFLTCFLLLYANSLANQVLPKEKHGSPQPTGYLLQDITRKFN